MKESIIKYKLWAVALPLALAILLFFAPTIVLNIYGSIKLSLFSSLNSSSEVKANQCDYWALAGSVISIWMIVCALLRMRTAYMWLSVLAGISVLCIPIQYFSGDGAQTSIIELHWCIYLDIVIAAITVYFSNRWYKMQTEPSLFDWVKIKSGLQQYPYLLYPAIILVAFISLMFFPISLLGVAIIYLGYRRNNNTLKIAGVLWLCGLIPIFSIFIVIIGLLMAIGELFGTESTPPLSFELPSEDCVLDGKRIKYLYYGVLVYSICGILQYLLNPRVFATSMVSNAFDNFSIVIMISLVILVGYIMFFLGLREFRTMVESPDAKFVNKLYIATILNITALMLNIIAYISYIMILSFVSKIISIIAFAIMIYGFYNLKKSETFPLDARKGASKLFIAMILLLCGVIMSLLFMHNLILREQLTAIVSIVAFVLNIIGWKKILDVWHS